MCAAGCVAGSPASTTRTLRRARDRTRAAESPAAPPPTIDDVVCHAHAAQCWDRRLSAADQRTLPEPGKRSGIEPVDARRSRSIATGLEQVGPRLKQLRPSRLTLTALAETTGISKSTLSRLETGQRRPTLELLLALAQAYRVPLDDLVAAPDVGDPRIRLKPDRSRAAR